MPASSGRKVMSASSILASSRSSGGDALLILRRSKSVSHHGASGGNSGCPSGRCNAGRRLPCCAAWSACSIQCRRPCKTRAVSGCGLRICERAPKRKGTRRRSSYRGANLLLTDAVGSAPPSVGVYTQSPVTEAACSKMPSTSQPSAAQAAATSSKRSAGGRPTAA